MKKIKRDGNFGKQIKARYIGEDDPLSLRNGKVYEARYSDYGFLAIVDETHDEYAYPPELFEIVEQ